MALFSPRSFFGLNDAFVKEQEQLFLSFLINVTASVDKENKKHERRRVRGCSQSFAKLYVFCKVLFTHSLAISCLCGELNAPPVRPFAGRTRRTDGVATCKAVESALHPSRALCL